MKRRRRACEHKRWQLDHHVKRHGVIVKTVWRCQNCPAMTETHWTGGKH